MTAPGCQRSDSRSANGGSTSVGSVYASKAEPAVTAS